MITKIKQDLDTILDDYDYYISESKYNDNVSCKHIVILGSVMYTSILDKIEKFLDANDYTWFYSYSPHKYHDDAFVAITVIDRYDDIVII